MRATEQLPVGMGLPPPGFDRVVISCRACGEVGTLDLSAGIVTPLRLSVISLRCSAGILVMPSVGETPLSPPGKGGHFERDIRWAGTNRRLRRQQLARFARVE